MTIKQMEYFVEIARVGSVSKAAQILNISQPPLSMQLKALETELGAALFLRTRNGLRLTQEGAILQSRVKAILSLISETTQELQAISANKERTLRIGSISSINSWLLPRVIAEFRQTFPHVNFQVTESHTEEILQSLHTGSIDFAFVRDPFNLSSFRSIPIHSPLLKEGQNDFFAAIAQPQFFDMYCLDEDPSGKFIPAIPLGSLRGKPLVLHDRYQDMMYKLCQKQGFTPRIICQNHDIHSSLCWSSAGIGITITPYSSVTMGIPAGLMVRRLDGISACPQARLAWNPFTPLSAEATAFLRMF